MARWLFGRMGMSAPRRLVLRVLRVSAPGGRANGPFVWRRWFWRAVRCPNRFLLGAETSRLRPTGLVDLEGDASVRSLVGVSDHHGSLLPPPETANG